MHIHMLITLFCLGLVDLGVEEKGRGGVCDGTQLSTIVMSIRNRHKASSRILKIDLMKPDQSSVTALYISMSG